MNEDKVLDFLAQWGTVGPGIRPGHWVLHPDDVFAFCEATQFQPCEAKYGQFNIVIEELHRLNLDDQE